MTAPLPLSPIVYYPGSGKPVTAPAPIVLPPPAGDPWSQVQLVKAGYSTPGQWFSYTGVKRAIRGIVWHDMEGYLAGSIARWNTGVASAHLCILRNGTVVLTCEVKNVAWHAGTNNIVGADGYGRTPFWRQVNINGYSIGVELEGFVASGYTEAQVVSASKIARWAWRTYGIPLKHTYDQIDGHHTHAEISSTRSDPGPLFNLDRVLA